MARVFGLDRELGIALQQLATVVALAGDWRRARSLLREALQAMQRDPMLLFISRALELMGSSAAAEGAAEDAARLYGAAQAIREAIGAAMWSVDRTQHGPYMGGSALVTAGRLDEAVAVLSRLVEREPTQESTYRALMLARTRSGDTAGAMRDYRRLEELLRREVGSNPARETVELHRRLQRGEGG